MLNGVGGCTIAEAKANLSYAEVLAWAAYRDKHGTLNVGRRMELSTAIIALQVNRGREVRPRLRISCRTLITKRLRSKRQWLSGRDHRHGWW